MSLQHAMESIEASTSLTSDVIEDSLDAIGFTQSVHDLFTDMGIVNSNEVDVHVLEKSFEGFLGEVMAAAVFLSGFTDAEEKLLATADKLQNNDTVPSLVTVGCRKLAERVAKTRRAIQDLPAAVV